jgi:hypothetical protein
MWFWRFPPLFSGALACCLGDADFFLKKKVVQRTAPEFSEPTQCSAGTGCVSFIKSRPTSGLLSHPHCTAGAAGTKKSPLPPDHRIPRCSKAPHTPAIASTAFSASSAWAHATHTCSPPSRKTFLLLLLLLLRLLLLHHKRNGQSFPLKAAK